uniref:3-oxoacid CoA-transferase n=1 Tax=Romanomermis culicivorax TaxID=13658 RepID=A0A915KRV1_ROMCU
MISQSRFSDCINMFKINRRLSTSSCKNSSRIDICGHELEAVKDIPHGAKVFIGGFGSCGVPESLINGLIQKNSKNLTVVSNNAGTDTYGVGLLLKNRQIRRLILSFTGPNKEYDRQFANGELEVELIPQGTLIEKLRAGGAGIPAFYTRTGYGTMVQHGGLPIKFENDRKTVSLISESREHRRFEIGDCILEKSIVGDFSLIKAWKADRDGNLTFRPKKLHRKTARNFNVAMCHAAKTTIVEVDEIVDVGQLDPESVHVPGIYVDRIVKASGHQRCLIPNRQMSVGGDSVRVNLGIGIPLLCAQFIPKDVRVFLHGENGLVGVGPYPDMDHIDPDIVNAGGESVTIVPGGAYQTSEESFAMIRGYDIL